jgi:hypothetical protein
MNTILLKVQQYLDNVSKNPVQLDKQLVQEFGEACKNALLKQFEGDRRGKFEPRMSNVGRPLCQLQMEKSGMKGEGQPYNIKMRNTFGDIIEALAILVMKSAGVNITNEQKKLTYKFNGDKIEGRQDVEIDGKVWDIKSASPYSFEKKFGEAGGFNEVTNKSTGEWTICETPSAVEEHKQKAIKLAKDNFKALKDNVPFKKCYDDVAETFRSKPTGNRVLGFVCSYCPYKLPCWGSKLQLLPQQQSKGKNPKWVWYTTVTNPKEETTEYGGD